MSIGLPLRFDNPTIGLQITQKRASQIPFQIIGADGSTLFSVGNGGNIGTAGSSQAISVTSSATALSNTIPIDVALTLSATGIVSGNGYALRSITTVSGTITGGAFVSGIRTGVRFSGTMNHADSRVAGLFVKLDDTGATETAGQMSVLWVDHGAGITGAHGGQFNMIRITDTVSGSKGNAVVYAYANATNFIDLGAPGGVPDFFVDAGTGGNSAAVATGGVAAKVLKCSVGGVDYWIPLFSSNS